MQSFRLKKGYLRNLLTNVKIAKLKKNGTDLNKDYVKPNDSSASSSTLKSSPPVKSLAIPSPIFTPSNPIYASMIAHWNPLPVEISSLPNSMVTHTVVKPPSPILSLCSAEEFQEMIDKMCERVFANLGWNNLDKKN